MFKISQTKVKTYTAKDVIKTTSNLAPRAGNSTHISFTVQEQRDIGMGLISKYVREFRFELLGTFATYRIICNGWGEFTYIEVDEGEGVDAKTVYRHMIKSEEAGAEIATLSI